MTESALIRTCSSVAGKVIFGGLGIRHLAFNAFGLWDVVRLGIQTVMREESIFSIRAAPASV